MKKLLSITVFLFPVLFMLTACQDSSTKKTIETETNSMTVSKPAFDSLKAIKYGADPYGMKKYVIAFLKRGPNRDLDKQKAADLQAGHMANIKRMSKEGKLVLAGPFLGNDDLRGIYIFNVETIEEATALTSSDPRDSGRKFGYGA